MPVLSQGLGQVHFRYQSQVHSQGQGKFKCQVQGQGKVISKFKVRVWAIYLNPTRIKDSKNLSRKVRYYKTFLGRI